MKRGGYPPGVFEHTAGAPWNEYDVTRCAGCGLEFYPNECPRGPLPDDMRQPPETRYGIENGLCATCETERDYCAECGATFLTADGLKPHTVDGCADCRADAPCIHCGAPVSVCECNTSRQCDICGARQFSILGTLGGCVWYRCRNCGADRPRGNVDATRAAVSRAADISESIDGCPLCGSGNWNGFDCWNCNNGYSQK